MSIVHRLVMRFPARAVLICVAALQVGCTTVAPPGLDKVGTAIGQTHEQADLFFRQLNDLARQASIDAAVDSTEKDLKESLFRRVVEPAAVEQWDNAFDALGAYVAAVQQLIAPERSQPLADAAVGLANQLATGSTNTALPPGLASTFTELARVLVDAKAQHDALAIMRRTDPQFRDVMTRMADAIRGLKRDSVGALFEVIATPSKEAWAVATISKDAAAKRAALIDFSDVIDQRDQMLGTADALSNSILLLADAHTQAANGTPADAAAILSVINKRLDEAKALYKQFDAIKTTNVARNAAATKPS